MMRNGLSRLHWLMATTTAVGWLCGCSTTRSDYKDFQVTPVPVPTAPTSREEDGNFDDTGLARNELNFDINVLSAFSESAPARLAITTTNIGTRRLTALETSMNVFPFRLDEQYIGIDKSGEPGLLMVPEDLLTHFHSGREVAQNLGQVRTTEPVDECWKLPRDRSPPVTPNRRDITDITLYPGQTRATRYDLYLIYDCRAGTYTFAYRIDLLVGERETGAKRYHLRLQFVLEITNQRDVNPVIQELVIPSSPPPVSGSER